MEKSYTYFGVEYNPEHGSLGKTLTNIIRVMQNIGFTTSPEITTSAPENIGATIGKMAHGFPTIW